MREIEVGGALNIPSSSDKYAVSKAPNSEVGEQRGVSRYAVEEERDGVRRNERGGR